MLNFNLREDTLKILTQSHCTFVNFLVSVLLTGRIQHATCVDDGLSCSFISMYVFLTVQPFCPKQMK